MISFEVNIQLQLFQQYCYIQLNDTKNNRVSNTMVKQFEFI